MRFFSISDTHGKHRLLKNLPEADAIIHAGDISKDGSERSVLDFLAWFSKLNYRYKIFIAGNHDFFFERESPAYIQKHIPPNVIYLQDSGIQIEGINIWGSPVTPRFFDWAFNRDRGTDINKHWKKIPLDTDIIITHGPPKGILDNTGDLEVGCEHLLKRIKKIKPRAHIFGHIHSASGIILKNQTTFINAGVLDDNYNLEISDEPGFLLEID